MARFTSCPRRGIPAVVVSSALAAAAAMPAVAAGAVHGRGSTGKGALVKLAASPKYGKILVDAGGRTLYLLTAGASRTLPCTGACASVWPPLLTKGKPRAAGGVGAKMLGTVKRGTSLQVTYAGHPLYLYSGDSAAHQANGEGIASFGGTWYVLGSNGSAVKASTSSGTSSSSSGSGGWGG